MNYAPKTRFLTKPVFKKITVILIAASIVIAVGGGCYIGYLIKSIPDEITLYKNSSYDFDKTGIFSKLFSMEVQTGTGGVLYKDGKYESENSNQYTAQVSLAGGIDIKKIKVNTLNEAYVIPAGNLIGVKLFCPGVLVTDVCTFPSFDGATVCPASHTGIKNGDLITNINNTNITTVQQLSDIIRSSEEKVTIIYKRNNKTYTCSIIPKPDTNRTMRIGLMVKDSAAGIGTMTYYNPLDNSFGALGHAVTDPETDEIIPISEGNCDYATVANIVKGEKGIPGEMHGMFMSPLGDVTKNTDSGIYGYLTDKSFSSNKTPVMAASMNEVVTGKATIITTIEKNTPKQYEIEIEKISTISLDASKGMVIRITDPDLISKTGGIIQGMSGSPILQNGRIVGAVTHVFVNDPTRGYGIFIENMLAEAEKIK